MCRWTFSGQVCINLSAMPSLRDMPDTEVTYENYNSSCVFIFRNIRIVIHSFDHELAKTVGGLE